MLRVKNLARVMEQAERFLARAEREATEAARGLAAELANRMIENSPQWSGDFASNWRFSVNSVDYSHDEGDVPPKSGSIPEPWQQFSRPAVQMGKAKIRGMDASFKLGDTIFISNSSSHGGETYAGDIFSGKVRLREVNRNVLIADVLSDFNAEFGVILGPSKVNKLRKTRAGV